MNSKTILIVEDEPKILEVTKSYLENEGFKVLVAITGSDALTVLDNQHVDLILLDLMLPDISGETICKKIRLNSTIPIIMLTAKTDDDSIIKGLMMGADDYITKPFSPRQLVARVITLFRRIDNNSLKNNSNIYFDMGQYSVYFEDNNLQLTKTEFLLFSTLANRSNKIFTREELADQVYNGRYEGYIRSIDSHIKNIRLKISKFTEEDYIKTVRGIGYQFYNMRCKKYENTL